MKITIINGDSLELLDQVAPNSIGALVTDPPYGLSQHTQQDVADCLRAWVFGGDYTPTKAGFMGKSWDGWVPGPRLWAKVYTAMKPGAYGAVFAGSRTVDLMGISLRLAGFEVRDLVSWMYGSGFPKSLNGPWGGTALKPAHEPILLIRKPPGGTVAANVLEWGVGGLNVDGCRVGYASAKDRQTMADAQWTVQDGVTGKPGTGGFMSSNDAGEVLDGAEHMSDRGRWPPNVLLSHSPGCRRQCGEGCPVDALGRQSGDLKTGGGVKTVAGRAKFNGKYANGKRYDNTRNSGQVDGDEGTAARFFPQFDAPFRYHAKASRSEREAGCEDLNQFGRAELTGRKPGSKGLEGIDGNNPYTGANYKTPIGNVHPTVKPRGILAWLVRLICPPGETVLDPFLGSGSTALAVIDEGQGRRIVGIERDPEYVKIARARVAHADPATGQQWDEDRPPPRPGQQGKLF